MRRLLLIAAGLCASSCGPPSTCCLRTSNVARDAVYVGTLPSPDGGTPTEVHLSVTAGGSTSLTFSSGGHQVSQEFDAVVFP